MALRNSLTRRQRTANLQLRIYIPKDLQLAYGGKKEILKSLGTSDPKAAKRLHAEHMAAFEREFAEMRRRRDLTPDDVHRTAHDHYQARVADDERFRTTFPDREDLDAVYKHLEAEFGEESVTAFRIYDEIANMAGKDREARRRRRADLKRDLAQGETRLVRDVVMQRAITAGLDVEPGSAAFKRLAHAVMRAEIEALDRAAERDTGDWGGRPRDPLIASAPTAATKSAPSILTLYEQFKLDRRASVSEDTWRQNLAIIRLLVDFLGDAGTLDQLDRKAVRAWKDALRKWPRKAPDIAEFNGLPFKKVIEANERVRKPTISEKTINKYLSAVGSFSGWLLSNDLIETSLVEGFYIDIDKRKPTRSPFEGAQLNAIFGSPLFTGCASDGREAMPGEHLVRDWRFWVPLIAAFSGARLGEILQLRVGDIREERGVWFIHITEEGEGEKSTKTAGSMRVVPIHSTLIKLGFLDYLAAQGSTGPLFSGLKRDARGFLSGDASKFFNRYFASIGVKVDKSQAFHSFRHSIADAFRTAGYMDEQFAPLLGHTKATTTQRYGRLPEVELKQRSKMIEAVNYKGLNLDRIVSYVRVVKENKTA
jgi:integrase